MIVQIQQSNDISQQSGSWMLLNRCLSELRPMLSYVVSSPCLIFVDQKTPSYVVDISGEQSRLHGYHQVVHATHKWKVSITPGSTAIPHSSWVRPVPNTSRMPFTPHPIGIRLDHSPHFTAASGNGGTWGTVSSHISSLLLLSCFPE